MTTRLSDGESFALKAIVKRRPIYVEILKSEVAILQVRGDARRLARCLTLVDFAESRPSQHREAD
jgi:hypothetical protein